MDLLRPVALIYSIKKVFNLVMELAYWLMQDTIVRCDQSDVYESKMLNSFIPDCPSMGLSKRRIIPLLISRHITTKLWNINGMLHILKCEYPNQRATVGGK